MIEQGPTRVSITGIDGAGKDSISDLVAKDLTSVGVEPVVKLNRPAFIYTGGGKAALFEEELNRIDHLHNWADRKHHKSTIVAVNGVNVMLQSHRLEKEVEKNNNPEVIMSARDWRLDPAVYAEYYMKTFSKLFPMQKRIKAFQALTGSERDLIVLLKVDPETAMERINERMIRESGESPDEIDRAKWQHIHENIIDLEKLRDGYPIAIDALQKIRPETRIVEIDTNHGDKNYVADIAATAILDTINGKIEPGERRKY